MPVKRSRVGGSTSRDSAKVANSCGEKVDSTAAVKAGCAGEASQSRILDIGGPIGVGESEHVKIGGFLERCHYCKKRIAQDSEVFMYSNLCAFCSAECRDLQIAQDNAKQEPANPKQNVAHGQGINNVKGQLGSYNR